MSDARRLVALIVAVIGLGVAVFGVVRGLSKTGPAQGIRMTVAIEPPVDSVALAIAKHVVTERIDEKGLETRVMPAGDKLVVEIGDADPETAIAAAGIIERTAKLDVVDATTQQLVLEGRSLRGAEVSRGGVAIEVPDGRAFKPGMSLAFVFEGQVRATHSVDGATATNVHVTTGTDDAGFMAAEHLVAMIHAGAVRPLHVTKREPFTRTTGFLPRAWLFLVIGGVLLAVGALLFRK